MVYLGYGLMALVALITACVFLSELAARKRDEREMQSRRAGVAKARARDDEESVQRVRRQAAHMLDGRPARRRWGFRLQVLWHGLRRDQPR